MNSINASYEFFNVDADAELTLQLKQLSNFDKLPQLYSQGELIGGIEVLDKLSKDGDIHILLKAHIKEWQYKINLWNNSFPVNKNPYYVCPFNVDFLEKLKELLLLLWYDLFYYFNCSQLRQIETRKNNPEEHLSTQIITFPQNNTFRTKHYKWRLFLWHLWL